MMADFEAAAEVYSAAADKDQAKIVFEEARRMVDASPDLSEMASTLTSSIFVRDTLSSYKALSSDGKRKHGLNPHGVIVDELHALPPEAQELFDALTTAQGARRQPLTIFITTAGYDRSSICWREHDHACKVRDGITKDPNYLPVIFAADPEDDWRSPETWKKANPNYGVTVSEQFLRDELIKAQGSNVRENTFKRLYLNIWTEQAVSWLNRDAWDRCGAARIDPEDLAGRRCYGGLDLANTSDIASFVAVFPQEEEREHEGQIVRAYDVLCRFWVPEERAEERARQDRVDYPKWIAEGLIRATPGNVIDYDAIREDVKEFAKVFEVAEIAYDPWNAIQLCTKLREDDGLNLVEHAQSFKAMNNPTKALEAAVLGQRIRHGGNPVLRWMALNVVVATDSSGNLKPVKKKSREKIDGMVALIMALGRAEALEGESVYDSRGIIVI